MSIKCVNCNSENIKKFSRIYEDNILNNITEINLNVRGIIHYDYKADALENRKIKSSEIPIKPIKFNILKTINYLMIPMGSTVLISGFILEVAFDSIETNGFLESLKRLRITSLDEFFNNFPKYILLSIPILTILSFLVLIVFGLYYNLFKYRAEYKKWNKTWYCFDCENMIVIKKNEF